ncbi:type I DNA topoisomerase [Sandaracinobacter sp. RS1-74]|uniref:type I DNA topoisomerase n=1 Tax=Sandaracinobacteroides sayramensis TaxID=2913411 RepID=UPI001EDBF0D3|nr:type I DNA topoisomerase [Sandaracinobacteroides sayramensis]MCG2840597.1 type I DNA topoisomerase [Sandaracinobacteroides sayramensis]
MDLVIVESPAKARTIEGYLGGGAKVLASFGHVRDLPASDGSVDPEQDFAMRWEVSSDRSKQLKAITDAAKQADRIVLATDPDREGEAISWHLAELLAAKKAVPAGGISRITFNAITRDAVKTAMANPRDIDQPLVDAYLARRALDYLVGFTLSPVLWRKLPGAKSAGRVQSVALRLIVEREREIEAFTPREYWTVEAGLKSANGVAFHAKLTVLDGRKLDKFALPDKASAEAAKARVETASFSVGAVDVKNAVRNPAPPFTTSTLQQEASRKLGLGAQQTMRTAQTLYEAGHITYMRTDGVSMDGSAIGRARDMVMERYGRDYVPEKPRHYTSRAKNAQEAHEAIRPTDFARSARTLGLSDMEGKLYDLIWTRAVASQMASAQLERTAVDLVSEDGQVELRATGTVVVFPGFLTLYTEGQDDGLDDEEGGRLPKLMVGDKPATEEVKADQHFTQPPPRYSEASLVKRMEELGIGRPSTYASIIQVLKDRDYVLLEQKRFRPQEKGRLVTAFLERFFERYVEYDFTAGLEGKLDDISAGEAAYLEVLRDFWADFKPRADDVLGQKPWDVEKALDEYLAPHLFPPRADGGDPRQCPGCGDGRLALKVGKFGPFISCSNYPECRYTRQFAGANGEDTGPQSLGDDPATGLPVEVKSGRFGRYVQSGEKRSSIPRDVDNLDLAMALKLLSLPREIGLHPESGLPIVANLGRYGPYLLHDGKYANLKDTSDLFEMGMNAAVVKLAEPKGGRGARTPAEPLAVLGAHPETGVEVKVLNGRFGPYITDGSVNANVPKGGDPKAVTLEQAVELLAERAARAPAKGKKKAPAKKPAAKKPAAKKAAPKKKASA